jgi:hypothetical protein
MPSTFRRLQKHEKEQRRATKRLVKRARKERRREVRVAAPATEEHTVAQANGVTDRDYELRP